MDGMVIVGAGECGTRAAFALRELGYNDRVTLIGDEPLLPYERPPLSKPVTSGGVQVKWICTNEALADLRIDYVHGTAVESINAGAKSLTMADGRAFHFDRLLLATGARPRRLSCQGAEHALDFRTRAHAEAIYARAGSCQSVAIIGAGLIGMELAAVLRGMGLSVSVVEAAPRPLGRAVPPRLAAMLHSKHVEAGVHFHFERGVAEIRQNGVELSDGAFVPAEMVVAAIGVQAETRLAEAADIATDNGIVTDRYLMSSMPDVFAAGDCASVALPDGRHFRFESWRNARSQAETAARNMIGNPSPFTAVPWFWSDQYDMSLQVTGLCDPAQEPVLRALPNGLIEFYLRDGKLVAAAGLGRGNSVAKDIKLAEMLIEVGASPPPAALADASVSLKTLLKGVREPVTQI